MTRYAFLIGRKNGEDIQWRDTNGLIRLLEEYSTGRFIEHEESRRASIEEKDENVPYRLLLIAEMQNEDYTNFKEIIKNKKFQMSFIYELVESKDIAEEIVK